MFQSIDELGQAVYAVPPLADDHADDDHQDNEDCTCDWCVANEDDDYDDSYEDKYYNGDW